MREFLRREWRYVAVPAVIVAALFVALIVWTQVTSTPFNPE